MPTLTYKDSRSRLETYFDRTAAETWAKLTSDAPVSGIRATVRAGRDRMRATLLSYLPLDLQGRRILDAGCGTGAFAVEAAKRGAHVVAIDLSPTLVNVARERLPHSLGDGTIEFRSGDMLDPDLGTFDHMVAMDSLIHYQTNDIGQALAALAPRVRRSMIFTFAPKTPALTAMHSVGKLFPRSDRSPAIIPVSPKKIGLTIARTPALAYWSMGRSERIASGFYTSQAQELLRQ